MIHVSTSIRLPRGDYLRQHASFTLKFASVTNKSKSNAMLGSIAIIWNQMQKFITSKQLHTLIQIRKYA